MDINDLIAIVKKKLQNEINIENIKIEDKSFLHKNHASNQEGKFHLKISIIYYIMKNICDWNNCNEIGEYKAPVEKDNSKKFRMLCLEHVKEFNKNWNYFSGMNDDQVMDFLKSDMIWHKPTQSFSSSDNFFKVLWNTTLKDELDKDKINGEYDHMRQFKFDHKDIKAFSILGISVGLKWKKIQDKFKVLVKKFHPDMNSGNKKYEEKLKLIT